VFETLITLPKTWIFDRNFFKLQEAICIQLPSHTIILVKRGQIIE
jgi:hypothetical protein